MNLPMTEVNRVFDLRNLPPIFLSCVEGGRELLEGLGQFSDAVDGLRSIFEKIKENSISLSPSEVHYCIAALCEFKARVHLHDPHGARILSEMTACIDMLENGQRVAVDLGSGSLPDFWSSYKANY